MVSYFDEKGAAEAYKRLLGATEGENAICLEYIFDPTEGPETTSMPVSEIPAFGFPQQNPFAPQFPENPHSAYSMSFPYTAPSFPYQQTAVSFQNPMEQQHTFPPHSFMGPSAMETDYPSLHPSFEANYPMNENLSMLQTQPVHGLPRPENLHAHAKSVDPTFFGQAPSFPYSYRFIAVVLFTAIS